MISNKSSANTVSINWKPDKKSVIPIYLQIINYICKKISSGDWLIGSHLPSQRALATLFEVNRSTIVTSMDELMSRGIIKSEFGGGTKIVSNTWSLIMSKQTPDWNKYVKAGLFQANIPTIQIINRLEFENYIRLGTGELSPELFPHDMMKTVLNKLSNSINSLNYLEPLGLLELRQALSIRLAKYGINAPPSCILITSGSLQALQLISICMLQKGSTVYTEAPTYLKSLQVFQSAGMTLSGIPMDNSGIKYWMMDDSIQSLKKHMYNQLLYTIPTFQNPTGTLMSQDRRKDLLQFCQNLQLPVIEDAAYSELWIDNEPPFSLKSMDTNGTVLYLGTVSKTLAPGLRIGWVVGPESVVERLGDTKMQVDYGASSLSQWVLKEFLESGLYDTYLMELRTRLKIRRDNAIIVLNECFSDIAEWNIPSGGFYIWVRLKKNISIDRLFKEALKQNILLNPGNIYDFTQNQSLRISYAYENCDIFKKSMYQLSTIIKSMIKSS